MRLAGPVADEDIDHDVIWLDAMPHQSLESSEQPGLILAVVPCGIDSPDLHGVVPVVDACYGCRRFIGEHAGIDSLVERHLEMTVTDLRYARRPVRLTEKVVVEQDDLARPWLAAPDFGDGLLGPHRTLFARHDAKRATQPAPALSKADGLRPAVVVGVVLCGRFDADSLKTRSDIPARTAENGTRKDTLDRFAQWARPLKDQRRIDPVPRRVIEIRMDC